MSDLKSSLERVAEAGVAGIALRSPQEPRAQRRTRARSVVATLAGMCVVLAAVAAVSLAVRSPDQRRPQLFGQPKVVANASYPVLSAGMNPTLQIGDVVSATTQYGVIERGDVVRVRFPRPSAVVKYPPGGDAGFKRIIAVPGDVVEGRGGRVLVDGRELAEPYLHVSTSEFPRVIVPRDSYFLLGDNRPNSADSRQWGPVRGSEIIAIALRITAPAARAGPIAGTTSLNR
jgi:signal peptidase I